MIRLVLPFILLVALLVSGRSVLAGSAVLTVTNANDSGPGSLRDAIIAASSGSTINFDAGLSGQAITLTRGELDIGKNLTIAGPAGGIAVSGNHASRVFSVDGGVTVSMSYLTITNGNDTGVGGGGIYNFGTLSVTNSTVSGNGAVGAGVGQGGGIYNGGTLNLTDTTVSGNGTVGGGGGILSFGVADLSNVTVSGNDAHGGGGIYNGGTITLANVTVSGNHAASPGGGIYNFVGSLIVTNGTVSGNAAGGQGGGIYNVGGSATLTNVTVSGNGAASGGGILNGPPGAPAALVNLTNSIVANQTSGADCLNASGGLITSLGYNLDSDGTCNLTAQGDLPNTNPMLGPLVLNPPGSTETQALLAGSPAIDRVPVGENGCGATITTDQRAVSRPQGAACDIGAFELASGTGPKRAVLFITGIASEGGCDSGPLSGSLTQWSSEGRETDVAGGEWLQEALAKSGAGTSAPDFLYYVYTSGDETGSACGDSASSSKSFDTSDSCWSLDDWYLEIMRLTGQASRLWGFVTRWVFDHPGVELSIVAHSQGGVLAAYAAKALGLVGVKSIVTLDSPLRGIPWGLNPGGGDPLLLFLRTFFGCPLDFKLDSLDDMSAATYFMDAINSEGKPDAKLFTVNETGQDCTTIVVQICLELIPGSLTSTSWATDDLQVDTGKHQTVADGTGSAASENKKVQAFVTCAVSGIPNGFASCSEYAKRFTANVQQAQTAEQIVAVPGGASTFTALVEWPGSAIATTLVSPSNRIINASTTDTDVTHQSDDRFESFQVINPEPGQWTVKMFGQDVASGGENVSLATGVLPEASVDQDDDMIFDSSDSCPGVANPSQADMDNDGIGDPCDTDGDNDGVPDASDNCALTPNPEQEDINANEVGDACDSSLADFDGDGVLNGQDNCLWVENLGQVDTDHDGVGDACDPFGLGDVDCNAKADTQDLLTVLRSAGGMGFTAGCLRAADVNCDGNIDALDAFGLLRYVGGVPMEPIGTCPGIG